MINLNECKFGDRLKMHNGEMAIYIGKAPNCVSHLLFANHEEYGYAMLYAADTGVMVLHKTREFDISSRWEDDAW